MRRPAPRRGGRLFAPLILTVPRTLTHEQADRIKAEWRAVTNASLLVMSEDFKLSRWREPRRKPPIRRRYA